MLILYRTPVSPAADEIEERLVDLVVAHRVVTVEGATAPPGLPPGAGLPVLAEGDRIYSGREAVAAFLEALGRGLALDRQIQSDACYLDPDDPSTCL
jgi:hypothetical protein